jgi:hypothetical protein
MPVLSDVMWIYVILSGLYVIESLAWVPAGSLAFTSVFGKFAGPSRRRRVIGNDLGYLAICGPLPSDATFLTEPCPISLGQQGVVGYTVSSPIGIDRPADTGVFFEWAELTQIKAIDRDLVVNGRLLCRLASPASADRLADRLRRMANLEFRKARDEEIGRFVSEQFDPGPIRQRIDTWRTATAQLRPLSLAFIAWIYLVGPARYWGWLPWWNGTGSMVAYIVILCLLWWASAVLITRGHRALFPDRRLERWKVMLTSFISPAVAMRGCDVLSRPLIGMAHPMAAAGALCGDEAREQWAENVARDLYFPIPAAGVAHDGNFAWSPQADAVVAEYRQRMVDALSQRAGADESVADGSGSGVAQYRKPPAPEDPRSLGYCPRCLQEFAIQSATCGHCGGMAAVSFARRDDGTRQNPALAPQSPA